MKLSALIFVAFLLGMASAASMVQVDDVDPTAPSQPGFKTTISAAGLDYFRSVGVKILQEKTTNLPMPPMTGIDQSPIGRIEWFVFNFVVLNANFGTTSLQLVPGRGINLEMQAMTCAVTLEWRYKKLHWPHVADTGTATIAATATVAVSMSISTNSQRPQVTVTSATVIIERLDIQLHGGDAWLYQFFVQVLHPQIRQAIETELQTSLTTNVNAGINQALASLDIIQYINKEVEVDLGLTATPTFGANFMSFPQVGEFYASADPQECPANICPVVGLPDLVGGPMVQMVISDYVANSAGFVFYKLNKLHIYVTNSEIPSWAPIRLNTTSFQYIIPQLYQKFPNMLMELHVYSTAPPAIKFIPSGVSVTAPGNMEVSVVTPAGALQLAFTLSGTIATTGTAALRGMSVIGNLTYMQGNWAIANSNIGNFNIATCNTLINLLFSQGIMPQVNQYLATGIALPVIQGVSLVSPSLQYGNGYIAVQTNINYNPPAAISANSNLKEVKLAIN